MKIYCNSATELIEKRNVAKLALSEEIKLFLHLGVCSACRKYKEQSRLIDEWMTKRRRNNEKSGENAELKERIISALEDL